MVNVDSFYKIEINNFDFLYDRRKTDKSKLYNIINYYCKENCWFEGHNKQSKSFFEIELMKNLNFSRIDFLGNTADRGVRPNFLLTKKSEI